MRTAQKVVAAIVLLFLNAVVFSQQLRLGNNPFTVEKSAVLDLVSDNQGLLLPRITDTTTINTLNPPDGMVIFYVPDKQLLLRTNGYWKTFALSGSGVTSLNGNTGALTMDTSYISNFYLKIRGLHSVTAPLTYSSTTGVIGITQATTSTNGYLSSTDWNTFNNKQASGNYITDPGGNGILARTALNTTVNRTLTGTANRITITNGNGVSGDPTIDIHSSYAGQTSITTLGTISTGTWNGAVITEAYGGTNQSTYALGDILYSSAANTLSKLAGNITTTKKFLSQTGNGSVSAAPSWLTLSSADVGLSNVENTALSTWAGSTNITTLGTIGTGTWNGSVIGSTYGGTGINNAGRTLTINTNSGILDFSGASKTLTIANSITLAGTDGKGINVGAATLNKFLIGDGTNMVLSTSTIPTSAGATANKVLLSDGTNYVLSTPTFPNASATALKHIRSDGTNWIASTVTYPDASVTAGKVIVSDGTNYIASTPTFPNASATALKHIRSDGTNWIASTVTYPDASVTAGKVIVSDGTNYIASTPTFPNASATALKHIRSDGTNWIASTVTYPDASVTAGKVMVSDGTNYIASTPTFPNASATSRKIIVSDGTNWVASTETYAVPGTSGNVLTSDGTNWISQIPGWDFLGSTVLGSNAATTGAVTIAARDMLMVVVRVTGYSGGDIASFRFNADAGSNYWSRYLSSVAGGTTFVNNQNVSQTLARLFATSVTLQRSAEVIITNRSSNSKVGTVNGQTSSNAAGTAGILQFGGFEWVNTSAQITSIEMRTAGGANMSTGTGFAVFGKNF